MFEYKCIEGYGSTMAAELTKLSREGWELVGQPVVNDTSNFFATVRRQVTIH
jgi:hypothetical protein